MAKQYFSLFTTYGSQVLANAIAKNQPLRITQMAVGDGNGRTVTPTANQTRLVKEVHRANISAISVDPRNNKQVIFELTLPENVGGFYVREMGIFDSSNKLVAVANCPESFKPTLESGSGKVQVLRMILQVSSSNAVTLTVDDSVIFVTRGQLTPKTITASSTNGFDNTGHSHQIDQASTTQKGIVQLDDTPNSSATNKAATPNSVKNTIAKNTQFVKIHLSGTKSLNVDLTKREEIKSVLLGDNFNSDNFVHYQVTSPNGRNHNITNLPISDKSPVMLDFVIVGAYSLFKAHYVNLNRSFFCNVNWNNETLVLNWVEEINGTKRSDSVTSDSSDTVATSKAVKSANDNANGRVSKSGDTINGTLAIKSDYWRKFRLISKDASSWWVETPPNAAESRRMTFCHVTPATDTTAEIVRSISFPAITKNEVVAYQTWVKEQAASLTTKLNALTAKMNTLTESVNQQVNTLTESVNQQINTLTNSVNQQCEHIEIGDFSIEKYSNGLMIQRYSFNFNYNGSGRSARDRSNNGVQLCSFRKKFQWPLSFIGQPALSFPPNSDSISLSGNNVEAEFIFTFRDNIDRTNITFTIFAIGRWK